MRFEGLGSRVLTCDTRIIRNWSGLRGLVNTAALAVQNGEQPWGRRAIASWAVGSIAFGTIRAVAFCAVGAITGPAEPFRFRNSGLSIIAAPGVLRNRFWGESCEV